MRARARPFSMSRPRHRPPRTATVHSCPVTPAGRVVRGQARRGSLRGLVVLPSRRADLPRFGLRQASGHRRLADLPGARDEDHLDLQVVLYMGSQIARLRFYDSDDTVELTWGRKIPQSFSTVGEIARGLRDGLVVSRVTPAVMTPGLSIPDPGYLVSEAARRSVSRSTIEGEEALGPNGPCVRPSQSRLTATFPKRRTRSGTPIPCGFSTATRSSGTAS